MTTKSPELISNIPDIRGPNQNDGSPLLDIKPRIEKIDKLPPMPEMMRLAVGQLAECGLSSADLRRMTVDNPRRLLGLDRMARAAGAAEG